jgi:hypothetical protein
MYVLTMILVDCERVNDVVTGWIRAGAGGVTEVGAEFPTLQWGYLVLACRRPC